MREEKKSSKTKKNNQENLILNNNDKQKTSSKTKRIIIIVVSIVLALVFIYFGGVFYFSSHFVPGTSIDEIDVSFKNDEQVQNIFKDKVNNYVLTVNGRNQVVDKIDGKLLSLKYAEDKKVKEAIEAQDKFKWPINCMKANKVSIPVSTEYDSNKIDEAINNLKMMQPQNIIEPANAYPEYNGTQYVIHKEEKGSLLDPDKTKQAITKAIETITEFIDLDKSDCYKNPSVLSDNANLLNTVDLYNSIIKSTLTYQFGNATEELKGDVVINWLSIGDDGNYTVDKDKVEQYVVTLAEKYDTVGSQRNFIGADGGAYSVQGGTYGWEIDRAGEIEAIVAFINKRQNETREPVYKSKAAARVNKGEADWGNTYIDLNLTAQHMYFVKDGAVAFQADVVTGLPIPEKITSDGVFDILEKEQNKTLVGDIDPRTGQPEYRTPVEYWLRMTWSGIGFHTATWQPAFGGELYKTLGSHGCINMSLADSQTLYGICDVGTPVVSHY